MDFKTQVEAQIAEAESKDLDVYLGRDWWQIGPQEEYVFAIDVMRFPRMSTALSMFQVFMGQVAAEDYDLDPAPVAEERKRRPDLFATFTDADGAVHPDISLTSFQNFCREYTDVTFREAHAMFGKYEFWAVRSGITRYRDEPQQPEE